MLYTSLSYETSPQWLLSGQHVPFVTLKASSQEQVNKNEKLQIFGLTSSHCHAPQNNIKVFHFWEEKAGEEHQTTEAVRTVKNWQLKV